MKKVSLVLLLLFPVLSCFGQDSDDEKNVVISKATREFRYVRGNAEHPVQISEQSRRIYRCRSYRTEITVAEFYDDMETIDDVSILVDGSKKHGVTPTCEYFNVDGIFYSDAHVCYFQLPLTRKEGTSEVQFRKTTLDPRYFTNIFFAEDREIEQQEIRLIIPSWMEVEIREFRFDEYRIRKSVTREGEATVYTYSMNDIPAISREPAAPGITHYAPHILVLNKSAQLRDNSYTYFKTVREQYHWYKSLVDQVSEEDPSVKEKAQEITAGLKTDEEKVKKLFQWVQDNIRYIAFENGIAGFRPEKAQDVLKKKYGDCKGMANLLTMMLRSLNLDARRCWIGTRQIAYDYSTPSLSVDNHMICAWMYKGKPVFLDATEKYIGFGEVAERIQGRQTLVENGKDFLLEKVPVAAPVQNTSSETRKFVIEGTNLKGKVVQIWRGENKVWLLSALNNIRQDKQENALKEFLSEGKRNYVISNLAVNNLSDYNADLRVEYDVLWKDAVTVFGEEWYLDLDNRRDYESFRIDTTKRKLPYWFQFKNNLVFETELQLPPGVSVASLPEHLSVRQQGYSFTATYSNAADRLRYRREIQLAQTELKPAGFSQWNRDIQSLINFYDQQVILQKK